MHEKNPSSKVSAETCFPRESGHTALHQTRLCESTHEKSADRIKTGGPIPKRSDQPRIVHTLSGGSAWISFHTCMTEARCNWASTCNHAKRRYASSRRAGVLSTGTPEPCMHPKTMTTSGAEVARYTKRASWSKPSNDPALIVCCPRWCAIRSELSPMGQMYEPAHSINEPVKESAARARDPSSSAKLIPKTLSGLFSGPSACDANEPY
jgi:hypothetical protein